MQTPSPQDQNASPQSALFQMSLKAMIDPSHPLVLLADAIDWSSFDELLTSKYAVAGRPSLSARLMVGLHYLKATFNESDESVVAKWIENPYWQYFCGETYMQHRFPSDPTSMTKWRQRVGEDVLEKMLALTIQAAVKLELVTEEELSHVNVDTTVQPKNIHYPTDSRLRHKAIQELVKQAKADGITLRQSYLRVAERDVFKISRYFHAKQFKRARKRLKKLRNYLGRILRDIARKTKGEMSEAMQHVYALALRVHGQPVKGKDKIYSWHEDQVVCIAKGKARQRYEFGSKVSVVTSNQGNWVLASVAHEGNPYDGDTLLKACSHSFQNTNVFPKHAYVDKGYRGKDRDFMNGTGICQVYLSGTKRLDKQAKRRLKRRQAIEPVIGHMKSDHSLKRSFLKGLEGDKRNAILAGIGYNFAKLLKALSFRLIFTPSESIWLMFQAWLGILLRQLQGRDMRMLPNRL